VPGKRKVNYPPARTATRQPRFAGEPETRQTRQGPVTIELDAAKGRTGFKVGDRVRIAGTGLYAGELAVIERMSNGAISAAFVRTEAGRSRQVRTVDLAFANEATERQGAEAASQG
jgi:hypothetical protein